MSRHDHLINHFLASKETRILATELLRLAQLKTAPGSGREVREFTTGLPAICMLLASERLNNGDVSQKAAQVASCLKPKDFKRVYEVAKAAVDQVERSSCLTYHDLHRRYKSEPLEEILAPYIAETENELITRGDDYDTRTTLVRCAVYFWVCSSIKPKLLPSTEIFAKDHKLSAKLFVNLLGILNENLLGLRKKIQAAFKRKSSSPTKEPAVASSSRQSPRKPVILRELPTKDSPKKSQSEATTDEAELESPIRRSTRSSSASHISPLKATATRRGVEHSPVKVIQPPPLSLPPWKKRAVRELPSKDTPRKRPAEGLDMELDTVPPETSTKKRKLEFKPVSPGSPPATTSPTTKKAPFTLPSLPPPPAPPRFSPLQRIVTTASAIPVVDVDASASSDESEPEEPAPRRRFRPVYLEHKQWEARDPRLTRIWKKADKALKA
ncbi:hypothetical protein BDZ97DRAFT_227676 [Flammula alnicola]|nr:hypothetical protein BDZ97DRAFT_227676 [Flammula alnicola]